MYDQLKTLDAVLNILATSIEVRPWATDSQILTILTKEQPEFNNYLQPSDLMLEKLVKDDYIDIANDIPEKYKINFDGKLFNREGGYLGRFRSSEAEKKLQLNFQFHAEKIAHRLNQLTDWLAAGSIFLSLVEVIKLFTCKKYRLSFAECEFRNTK